MTKKNLFIFLFLIISSAALFAANVQYTVIRSDADIFHVKIHFQKPEMRFEQGKAYASYSGARYYSDSQNAYLPVLTKLFNLSSKETPLVKILKTKINSLKTPDYFLVRKSNLKVDNASSVAVAKYLGNYNTVPLFALDIFPVRYDKQQKKLQWYEEIELEVTAPRSNKNVSGPDVQTKTQNNSFLNQVVLNQKQTFSLSGQPLADLQKTTDAATDFLDSFSALFKILVDEEGIYKITYTDLEDAEFPLTSVNPSNLRLFNQGREVPLYLHGLADGSFDENDYIEFWGQRNEKTFLNQFPDVYADPFSDINVYWLAAGNQPGIKMSEESGRLLGGEGYVFQPYAYTETLHFEKDKHHENFGHSTSKINRPSYELDHWYFDSGISAPEGIAYDFYVPYPFESGSNVELTAAFRGKSYYSSSTNPLTGHQVDLKLRGKGDVSKLIGRVVPADRWRDQQMRFISNADSAVKISQSVLHNGINRIEVDMFQTGVTDIVLMNWFEIKYLRKYRAYKNYIKFHVDEDFFNNTYVNLDDNIQINVDGFDTSDISLYKIGVSKLLNGKISSINDDGFHSFGISFQDQIFDPSIEFVALTESAKKKPLSIVPFERWEGRTANETLRHPAGPVNYLIITHKLFYKNALLISKTEEVDVLVVCLGALLHDIADSKFHDGDEEIGPRKAREFLSSLNVDEDVIVHVENIIANISFKGGKHTQKFKSSELDVVQDADRLDAMGAIGVARTFNYGGHKGREIYNPEIKPNLNMTKEKYKNSNAPTLNHFYEKLLLLKDKMNTKTGKSMAEHRHKFMEQFLDEFYKEWNGEL